MLCRFWITLGMLSTHCSVVDMRPPIICDGLEANTAGALNSGYGV